MRSLQQYILESLKIYEGGTSVEGVSPIRGDLAKVVADEIIYKLRQKFGSFLPCATLGSVGKKGKSQTSGDIDIAIEVSWEDKDKYLDFVKDNLSDNIGNVNNSMHVFNFGYGYDEDGVHKQVQVDFMFVNDLKFAEFAYHSPDFTKNESRFKGLYQSTLLMAIVANTPIDQALGTEYKSETFDNEYDGQYKGQLKSYWRLTLSQSGGLKLNHKSYEGKRGQLKNAKTIESKTITTDVNKILKMCLGPEAKKEDCNSFESLLAFLVSDKYAYKTDKDQLAKIYDHFFTNSEMLSKTSKDTLDELKELFDSALKTCKNK